ncbi:MAG TPA: nucleotidyltransferase, partial [Firmicutes bacterium]|nr:nucleotidyltransferase [Bacillota bacterium]
VVGDNTVIEEGCRIKPNIKIWPAKRVEGGTFLNSSLVWGSRAGNSLFGVDGIGGTVNLELTPEMGAKLGAAYGSLVGEGEPLVLGGDSWHASAMIKEAIAAGLVSAGVKVLDLGQVVTPVTRWAVTELKARGGIHVQVVNEEACSGKIKVFDERGFNLTKNWERKIEQAFFREDFRRIRGSDVGAIVKPPDITALYFNRIAASVNKESIREHGFRLLWLYPSPYLYVNFMPLLRELYCQVVTFSPLRGKINSIGELAESKETIMETMKVTRSQAAFYMDDNAENLAFFDEKGSLVAEEMFTLFISLLLFQKGKGGRVAVPVTTPSAIDKLAGLYEGEVFRTKTSPAALMEEVEPSQFLLSFDALFSLIYILEYAAFRQVSLGELVEMIPAYYLRKKRVPCAWKDKGMVMRRLIEETGKNRIELLDGIKVHYPEGWALVLPDPEKPYYQVYSEGYSAEVADSLTDMYIKKIEDIQKREN